MPRAQIRADGTDPQSRMIAMMRAAGGTVTKQQAHAECGWGYSMVMHALERRGIVARDGMVWRLVR